MDFEIDEEPVAAIATLSELSIAFVVDRVFDVVPKESGAAGPALRERHLPDPYPKDYDAIAGNSPADWLRRFDTTAWGFITARSGGRRVGAAVVAHETPGMAMLDHRRDVALLWDIRVAPDFRGRKIGMALFQAAVNWAVARGCRLLKLETQNTNVAACRFYTRQGCVLGEVHPFAYEGLPDEIQLIWYKELL